MERRPVVVTTNTRAGNGLPVDLMYELHLSDIWHAVGQRRLVLVLLGASGLLLALGGTIWLIPRQWTASATIILSRPSALPSLSQLLPAAPEGLLGSLGMSPTYGSSTELMRVVLSSWEVRQRIADQRQLERYLPARSREEAAERLAEATSIRVEGTTSITIGVTLRGSPRGVLTTADDDLDIRRLAGACAEDYLEQLRQHLADMRITSAKTQRLFLEQETPQAQEALHQAQEALAQWQAEHQLGVPPKAAEVLTQSLAALQGQLVEAQVAGRAASQTITETRSLLGQQAEYLVATRGQQANPLLASVTDQLAQLEQALAEEQTFHAKLPEHPDVQRLLIRREELLRQLETAQEHALLPSVVNETRNPVHEEALKRLLTAQVEEQALGARARGIESALGQGRREMEELSWSSLEYARLYGEVQLRQAVYETLVKQYHAALLSEKAEEPGFYVLDPPRAPWKRSAPKLGVNAALGLIVGLLVGLLWIAAQEQRRTVAAGRDYDREA